MIIAISFGRVLPAAAQVNQSGDPGSNFQAAL